MKPKKSDSMNNNFKPTFRKPAETSLFLDRDPLPEHTTFTYNKYISQSIQTQRQRLPIFQNRNHILYLLEKYQTLVLVGETGSGKSTQIPQYLVEAEWPKQVAISQPRRVAAIMLAQRVADETGSIVQGDLVGYSVRFDSCTTQPKIKYLTEGILLREMMSDPLLNKYSVVMIDEVHERTLYTDILLGLLKKVLSKRPELRLIVASATLNAKFLQQLFNKNHSGKVEQDTSVIMSVEGRQFPVEIFYVSEPVPCYVKASVDAVLKINDNNKPGDVLVFLTGQEEVDTAVRILRDHADVKVRNKMVVLPMYGSLPYNQQLKVFQNAPEGFRKIVVATNIAETSITIPGIVYIIDCGFVKMKWYNTETHTDNLVTVPTSRSSADQRAGRAGRIRSGQVYRLYTEEWYHKMSLDTPPEMVRGNLTYAVLQLKAMGVDNVLKFKFPSSPPIENLKSALEILYALDAIDINSELTSPLGFHMAEFALDPLYSKILLSSREFGCVDQVLTIISMLQVENIFTSPSTGNMIIKARIQKRLFEVEQGDLITYLNIFNAFIQSDMSRGYCHKNFLNYNSLKRVVEIRNNLEKTLWNYNIAPEPVQTRNLESICKCLVTGLFPNAAYLHRSGNYKTVRGDVDLFVSPDSVLYNVPQPQWVVFCEVVHTTKLYMRELTVIQNGWLLELAPHFYYKTTFIE
ncbi:probable ATP-dependent RNA helicase DHX35 [Anthonomus grandis grandis]|uniref:probable ATP-dependent RNA helicase DHX35 n=1 Tax=Anthonomus grandis grandis TaxID=2921223 RepID=UPI002166B08E|nr:probable ATP-dependent RNA helicase DHX35 [Anthonomus grandis grandis]